MPFLQEALHATNAAKATIRRAHGRDLAAAAALYRQWEAEGLTWGLVAATGADLRARLGPFFLVADVLTTSARTA